MADAFSLLSNVTVPAACLPLIRCSFEPFVWLDLCCSFPFMAVTMCFGLLAGLAPLEGQN